MEMANELKIPTVLAHNESQAQLIVNQSNNSFQTKEERMTYYFQALEKDLKKLEFVEIKLIPRSQNSHADGLASLTTNEGIEKRNSITLERVGDFAIENSGAITMAIDPSCPRWTRPSISLRDDYRKRPKSLKHL